MTHMIQTNRPVLRSNGRRLAALLLSASGLALASVPASAQEVVFSDNGTSGVSVGQRMSQTGGVTQVRLPSGVMLSFVDAAEYTINADGTVDLHAGTVTVAGADGAAGVIRMPDGAQASVTGAGSAGSFTVTEDGQSTGQTLTGVVNVTRGRSNRNFDAGEQWASAGRQGLRQTVSNGAQVTPSITPVRVARLDRGGPVAAAENGLPVSLGDALAAAGASADILGAARRVEAAAGNPDLATFPSGDLALLVAAAAQLEGLNGGTPFPQAQADIIRTYLGFLAEGGSGAEFLTAYAGFVTQYLDLLRSGALPSGFAATGVSDINAFLAYQSRLGALGQLAAQDRVLVEAYLAFLAGGGNVDSFTGQFTDLVEAYFAFVRAGGDPADFTGASAQLVDQYIAFLNDSGLLAQLSDANQALLVAYLANGGLGFAGEYTAALEAYFQFLTEGGLPSTYGELDQATLQAYLEALQAAGLLGLLGEQSQFFADYLAFVQGGGDPDVFTDLPVLNLPAFADALNAYAAFLAGGGLPNDFTATDLSVLANYLKALDNAGELESLLGANADLLNAYFAYLATGANADLFAGLPIYADYVSALQAYFAFLDAGGLPGDYTALTQAQIEAYLAALASAGGLSAQLGDLGTFYTQYFAFISAGGNPEEFAGLPLYDTYASALQAYFAFLAGGGLPGDYTALSQAQIEAYLAALQAAGGLDVQIGGDAASFFASYLAFLQGGGDRAAFVGLPIYADYVAALNAYFAFLAGGGLPADYTALTQAQIEAYLAALAGVQGGLGAFAGLDAFFADYYAFILGGGDPQEFAGLPLYVDYLAAIEAFYAFLLNGGLPSAYTALTQEQIEAYLALLANAGLLAGTYSGDELAFYTNYLAFLAGGGVPDSFAGLPGGGNTGGTDLGFVLANGAKAFIVSPGARGTASTNGGSVDAQGQPSGFDWQPANEIALDVGGNGDGVIGRFASNNLHYLIVNPITGSLPASGTIDYAMLAATSPTYSDNATAPGTFSANLTIGFGASLTYGIDGTITMPDATYTFASPGRSSGQLATPQVADPGFFVIRPDLSQTGSACESSDCYLNMFGAFGGENGQTLGFTYESRDNFNLGQPFLEGAVLFGATAADETRQNQSIAYANKLIGDDVHTLSNVTYNGAGIPIGYEARIDANEALTSGDMTLADTGTAGNGALSWARWTDGTPGGFWYNVTLESVGPNGGYHVIAGDRLTNLPASGAVSYDLIGFTTPTRHDESTSTGSVSGGAAVVFGANPVVALDLDITSGTESFNLYTTGKLTDPTQSTLAINPADGMFHTLGRADGFDSSKNAVFVDSAAAFCASSCAGFVEGFLAGDGASHMGLAYSIRANTVPNQFIDGTAAFAAGAPISLDSGDFDDAYNVYLLQAGSLSFGTGSATVDNSGVIADQTYGTSNTLAPDAGALLDVAGRVDDTVAFTSYTDTDSFYTNGTLLLLSGERAVNMPATGTVFYRLLDGTAPMDQLGTAGSEGYFTNARVGVSFGSEILVGMNFDVFDGTRGWHAQTAGGSDAPGNGGLMVDAANGGFTGSLQTTGIAGDACASNCSTNVYGALFGNGASHVGFSYLVNDAQTDQSLVQGIAVFGASGNAVAGIGTDPRTSGGGGSSSGGGSTTSSFTGTRDGIVYYTFLDGSLASGFGGSADLENGELTKFTSILGTIDHASADIVEAGDLGDVAWARWTNGTVESRTILGDADTALDATDGYHVMAGNPTIDLPAGTIAYELIGGTSATDNRGSAPGTLTGDLAIDFATLGVGYDLSMEVGGMGWAVSTTGGAADPSSSQFAISVGSGGWTFGGTFASTTGTVNATGGACAGTCIVNVSGTLYGANADYAALAMNVTDASAQNGTIGASGLAIFGQEGAASATTTSADPSAWARWEVPAGGSTSPVAGADMMIAPGIEALASSGIQYTPDQIAQLEAYLNRQVN